MLYSDLIEKSINKFKNSTKEVNILIGGNPGHVRISSLIDGIFNDNFSDTATITNIKDNIYKYSKNDTSISIIFVSLDYNYYDTLSDLEEYIETNNNDSNIQNKIHIAWIIISEAMLCHMIQQNSSFRYGEGNLICLLLKYQIPVISVIEYSTLLNYDVRKEMIDWYPEIKVVSIFNEKKNEI